MASVIIDRRHKVNGGFSYGCTGRVKRMVQLYLGNLEHSVKRIREEVRFSSDKVDDEAKEIAQGVARSSSYKLSTSKLVKKNKLKTTDL
jgi:hypothetical protein